MPEFSSNAAGNILNSLVEAIAENVPKQKSVSFFEEDTIKSQFNRLFGRQKPIYHLLGGGKSADVLLWRNKKISGGVLASATAVWVLFEWLNYHFLSLICFALFIGMCVVFLWSNASALVNRYPFPTSHFHRSQARVPRLAFPEDMFVNVAVSFGAQLNLFLGFLQDVASGGNLKQFVLVAASLFAAAIIGSWCNFLTVIYLGFVAAHTLPVLYERYEDQVDGFADRVLGELQRHYNNLDSSLLSKIPKGNLKPKKLD